MKRSILAALAALAAATPLLTASTASAQSPAGGGLEVGARLGYGIPLGDAAKDSKLSDGVSGQIPIWLDVGYRIDPNWYVGAYGQYGFASLAGQAKDRCDSCSAHDIRFGVNAHYHIIPTGPFDPWVGLGAGYEILSVSGTTAGVDVGQSLKGFEFANLQLGGDYRVSPQLGVGPFASFSFGQYSTSTQTVAGQSTDVTGFEKAMHEWFTIGVRGVFDTM